MRWVSPLLRLLVLAPLLAAGIVWAQSEGILNKLLAPGPLIKGHADLEGKDCLKCHDAGKGVPDSKCLDCHKEIRPFVNSQRGFHGLTQQSCRECHADHKGRDFNTVVVDEKDFDHKQLTGYPLDGKHAKIRCTECHVSKRTKMVIRQNETRWLGATATCISCHSKDDIHFFKGQWAKKDCDACHSTSTWKPTSPFDHLKETKYELVGKHAELKCAECHIVNEKKKLSKYKWTDLKSAQCIACHENVHKKTLSARFQNGKCTTCHSQTKWKIPEFDHSVTRYPLRGKHAQIECTECHKQAPRVVAEKDHKNWKWLGLKSACLSCHKDEHRFGSHKMARFSPLNGCVTCHNESDWKQIHGFDHDKSTRYAIDGKHLELKCAECHLTRNAKAKPVVWLNPGVYKWAKLEEKTCENCHKNPHIGKFSAEVLKKKCTVCHITQDWFQMKGTKSFDHDKTRFPLTGAHTATTCKQCHTVPGKQAEKQVYKFKDAANGFCVECHKNVHKGAFTSKYAATACKVCHSTTDFVRRLEFNHDETQMRLNGAHKVAKCEACHAPTGNRMTLLTPNVNVKRFPAGKPFEHAKYIFSDLKNKDCLTCHSDVHKGQLGRDCMKCHTETEWKIAKFDHTENTDYPLRDKHAEVACKECHKPVKNKFVREMNKEVAVIQYADISKACVDCHKDVHKGNFGKQCQECHTERGWAITKGFHTNFTLTGIHYELECSECHVDGRKLAGLSQQCLACHQKDDVHFGTLPNCKDCHRQQFWEVTGFRHSMTQFPLRGAHRTLDCVECHTGGVYQGLNPECLSCHLQDALTATARVHSIPQDADCARCHRQPFSWQSTR